MGVLIGGAVLLMLALAVAGVVLYTVREPGQKVRRKQLTAATRTVNAIDDIVDRYYSQLDIVGAAMATDIRQVISKHRKDTVS